jgi:hypothetical protein
MSEAGRIIIAGFSEDLEAALEQRDSYKVRFNLNGILAASAAYDVGIPMRAYELMREAFDVLNNKKGTSVVLTTTRRDLSAVDTAKYVVASCHQLADDDKKDELKNHIQPLTGLSDKQYRRWIETKIDDVSVIYAIGLYDPFAILDDALAQYNEAEGREVGE